MGLGGWERGSAAVLLPDSGQPLLFGATGFPVSRFVALGRGRRLLEGHANP